MRRMCCSCGLGCTVAEEVELPEPCPERDQSTVHTWGRSFVADKLERESQKINTELFKVYGA